MPHGTETDSPRVEPSEHSPEAPIHVGVSDQLRSMLDAHPAPATNESSSIEQDASDIEQFSETGKINTADEYLATELDSQLERHYLARRYQTLTNNPGATGAERRQQVSARPIWEEHFPDKGRAYINSDERSLENDQDKWQAFLDQYPKDMQLSLQGLYKNYQSLEKANQDLALMKQVETEKKSEHEIKQAAILMLALRRKAEPLAQDNQEMTWRAAQMEQPLSRSQRSEMQQNELMIQHLKDLESRAAAELTPELIGRSTIHAARLIQLRDRADLKRGLIETDGMKEIMSKHLASLVSGGKLLLVGETGGAKTALAKHIALESQKLLGRGKEANFEFVSAYGDLNAYQLIGKQELVKEDEATVTEFALGSISRAMQQGKPLIIDEINAMPPEIAKRLNEILQLKPGESYSLQENGGMKIVIQEGFCIIATANEKSHRYKGVNEMSTEFKSRFIGSTERIKYPDADIQQGEIPPEHLRLAMAALADKHGNVQLEELGLTTETLFGFLRAAHISQHLFSETATSAVSQFVSDSTIKDHRTGLDKEVIPPRGVVTILSKIRDSGGAISLQSILGSFIDGIPVGSSDRAVLTKVLESQPGLLVDVALDPTPIPTPVV